jgi:Domain of unknown function (DUF4253)
MRAWELPTGLPAGRFVVPRPSAEDGRLYTEPVLWVSEEPQASAGELWAALLGTRAETGLWPLLLLGVYVGQRMRDILPPELIRRQAHRPWHAGELEPVPVEGIADVTASQILARCWQEVVSGTADETFDFGGDELPGLPFREWPGLASPPPADRAPDPDVTAARIVGSPERLSELTGRDDPPYIGLTPATDGAAAIAACGWPTSAVDLTEAAAVVRSWQERFGARVCVLGINTLAMTVARHPKSLEEARLVAAEHFAFHKAIAAEFDEYAQNLIGAQTWFFWWD